MSKSKWKTETILLNFSKFDVIAKGLWALYCGCAKCAIQSTNIAATDTHAHTNYNTYMKVAVFPFHGKIKQKYAHYYIL